MRDIDILRIDVSARDFVENLCLYQQTPNSPTDVEIASVVFCVTSTDDSSI